MRQLKKLIHWWRSLGRAPRDWRDERDFPPLSYSPARGRTNLSGARCLNRNR